MSRSVEWSALDEEYMRQALAEARCRTLMSTFMPPLTRCACVHEQGKRALDRWEVPVGCVTLGRWRCERAPEPKYSLACHICLLEGVSSSVMAPWWLQEATLRT